MGTCSLVFVLTNSEGPSLFFCYSVVFSFTPFSIFWAFFCLLVKRQGEQIRLLEVWLWGACQRALAPCGLMECSLNPSSGKTGGSNGLWSSCIAKCLVKFRTARLTLKDWIYEKHRTIWLQPCNLGIQTVNYYLGVKSPLMTTDVLHYALRSDPLHYPCGKSRISLTPLLTRMTLAYFLFSGLSVLILVRVRWGFTNRAHTRNRIWAEQDLNFIVVTLKTVKRNRRNQFKNIFYLTVCIQNIIISTCYQYKNY